ncbi:MAG: hypothetical protein DCC75_05725 [Proteobacteria bacterium]|nr:MAG: hypothetical protein DCC75_05725 [Pseudomonadota bacterium]
MNTANRQRTPTLTNLGRIISRQGGTAADPDLCEIPFVPAFDLLEKEESRLSDSEACAIALALSIEVPAEDSGLSAWDIHARIEGVSRRL